MPKAKRLRRKTRRTRKRRVRKARKVSRKYYRRRYRRLRKYHRKIRRRRVKALYRIRSTVGLKFKTTWSLSDFLKIAYHDQMWYFVTPWLVNEAFALGQGSTVNQEQTVWLTQYMNQNEAARGQMITRRWWSVVSSDWMTHQYFGGGANKIADIGYRAFNPHLNDALLGPSFYSLAAQYRKFKYVGMKVKWIPNTKIRPMQTSGTFSTTAVTDGIALTDATNYDKILVKAVSATAGIAGQAGTFEISAPIKDAVPKLQTATNQARDRFKSLIPAANIKNDLGLVTEYWPVATTTMPFQNYPQQLRLWINFSKSGYQSEVISQQIVAQTSAPAGNIRRCNLKYGRVYAADGTNCTDRRLIRSFNLAKPFKFFVRPKMAKKIVERPEEETTAQLQGDSVTDLQTELLRNEGTQSEFYTTTKFPYILTPRFAPKNGLSEEGCAYEYNETNRRALRDMMDDLSFNPILFGWALTCDNLPANEQLDLFRLYKNSTETLAENKKMWNNYTISTAPNIERMGRFVITTYARFKQPRQHQSVWLAGSANVYDGVNQI